MEKKNVASLVNYFVNLGPESHFPKIKCSEFSFLKRRECQCNLPKHLLSICIKLYMYKHV